MGGKEVFYAHIVMFANTDFVLSLINAQIINRAIKHNLGSSTERFSLRPYFFFMN